MESEGLFIRRSAAERYRKGRPFYHPQVVRRIKDFLALERPLERAVDIGCGTGLSSVALADIAREVVGVDRSAAMIACAEAAPRVRYCQAAAERLPIRDAAADLVTFGSAWHWMDRRPLLGQARRILRPGGWLVVYDNAFSARMAENPDFQNWMQSVFRVDFPAPPRNRMEISETDAVREGFALRKKEAYQNDVKLTVRSLVDYLMTLSNIIAAVEGGGRPAEDVDRWLMEKVIPFYGSRAESTFPFGGEIWCFQKIEKQE